jgi:anti-anti-sigma regulatory factor
MACNLPCSDADIRRDESMLKITKVIQSDREYTLQLDGSISGQWIELLRESAASVLAEGLELTIDLKNICFIDCEGLALIKSLMGQGVRQVNAPLFVAEQLRKCEATEGD